MPGYQGHIAGGALVGVAGIVLADVFNVFHASPSTCLGLFAVTVTGSIFPDIDTHSKGRPWIYGAFFLTSVYLCHRQLYKESALLGMMSMLPCIGHHRGWTHTWWAMFLVPTPIILAPMHFIGWEWQAAMPWYIAAVAGYASHLILDKTL